jgi:hypothetical protein
MKPTMAAAMAYYRVYLLNDADRIYSYQIVECDDDDAVILNASRLLSCSAAVEIWAGARKVAYVSAKEFGSRDP